MSQTVLIVDDSKMMRAMLQGALTDGGYEVVEAEDGVAGLDVLNDVQPDVIITDINMPRLDGFGFIEGVRSRDQLKGTPILVLSTESDREKKLRARDAGATGWIVKPFDADSLLSAIRRVSV